MPLADPPAEAPRPAAYLRCYPREPMEMIHHQHALRRYAARLALPAPLLYFDNGCSSVGHRPRLERLIRAVAAGHHLVVLIPGPWVFCPDEPRARREMDRLTANGCQVLELPAHWPHTAQRQDGPTTHPH